MDNHNIITIGTALKWRGPFSNEKTYYQDNIILDAGCLFRCKIMQTQNHPPVRIIDENGHFEFINQDIWEVILNMSVYYNRIVGMEYIVGVAMTLDQLSASSRQAGVWYVKNTGLFYKKDADGNIEEADDAYNVIPSETETEQGALPHGRIDKIYRASDGVLFRLVKQENTYVLTDYIDRLSFDKELDTVRTSIQKTQTSVESAHTKISDLRLLPFDGEVPNASSLSSKRPGSIWFSRQDGLFLQVSQDGAVLDSITYNDGAHASTYYIYVNKNTLYRVRLDNNKASLYALVDQHDLSLAQNQLTTAINSTKTDIERIGILDFAGSLASLDSMETAADGMWFDDGTGKFVVKAEDGTVSDGGAEYNWIPTPELVGIGAVAHARTDKVYRDREGGLWHVVYDAEAENYVLTDYVDRLTLEATAASLEESATAQVTALRKATGVYPFDILVEHVNELGTGSLPGSIAYVIGSKIFYRKDSSGDWEPAGTDYNNAGGTGPTDNVFRFGNVLYVRSGFSGGLTSLVSSKDLTSRLASKADTEELSNVLAGEAPAPGTVTLPDFKTYTREELKKDLFIDYWNASCVYREFNGIVDRFGEYVEESDLFELCGTLLTYEEALEVAPMFTREIMATYMENKYCNLTVRAIPAVPCSSWGCSYKHTFAASIKLERIRFSAKTAGGLVRISNGLYMFLACVKLHTIEGTLYIYENTNTGAMFDQCGKLREVRIITLNNLRLADSPELSDESIAYLINHREGSKAITITLHPTAYARVTDELFETAASKNITIASA